MCLLENWIDLAETWQMDGRSRITLYNVRSDSDFRLAALKTYVFDRYTTYASFLPVPRDSLVVSVLD